MSAELNCHVCGGPLERGSVSIHGNVLGFLLIGASNIELFFSPGTSRQSGRSVLPFQQRRIAYHCATCDELIITRHRWKVER